MTIGRRHPVRQAGQVGTRQDRRDFTGGEAIRSPACLGFTCHDRPAAAPPSVPDALRTASAPLGGSTFPEV
ncbi:SCO5918 family protein [Streptomyces sp. NPDC021100]|uniref:SCO5918 family protein n=1 Tax=Streptomyces sp. NPDC021100 TaxID=3365114 RepID=UPI00379F6EBD